MNLQHDTNLVKGKYFEIYTPAAGPIVSPGLGKRLEYAQVYLSADADLTFVNMAGQVVTTYPLSKGRHYFLVKSITAVSTGTVAIVHDGVEKSTIKEQNTPIYSQ